MQALHVIIKNTHPDICHEHFNSNISCLQCLQEIANVSYLVYISFFSSCQQMQSPFCSSKPEMSSVVIRKDRFLNSDLKGENLFISPLVRISFVNVAVNWNIPKKTLPEHCSRARWQTEMRQWQRLAMLGFAGCVDMDSFTIINLSHNSITG